MTNAAAAPGSAFFFFGSLAPVELANFNVQNIVLDDGGVVEMLGPRWGMWWGETTGRDYAAYHSRCKERMLSLVAAYYLATGVALKFTPEHWAEALAVNVREAVLGFYDNRFKIVPAPAHEDTDDAIHQAIRATTDLHALPHLDDAARLAVSAAQDGTIESLHDAYRALECVRRHYDPDMTPEGIKRAWALMDDDLKPEREPFDVLQAAAKPIRHGDSARAADDEHAIHVALPRIGELIEYTRALVAEGFARARRTTSA